MGRVIVGMTSSLDGFVADANGSVERLYPDLAALHGTAYMNAMIDGTGAVVMGKKTFEMAEDPNWYVRNYEFQVPIFVLTHKPPRVAPKQDEHLTFTFVTDGIESAIAQARAAAGDKAVQVVGGVSVAQQLLHAGLADELHLDVMPVLLGAGRRFFDGIDPERVQIEKVDVQEVGARTTLRFRVKKEVERRENPMTTRTTTKKPATNDKPVNTVDGFLAALPKDKRVALLKVRAAIKAAAPSATEVISYGVPTFKQDGKALVGYGAAAEHCTLYLMGYGVMRTHAAQLKDYALGKGSIQFPASKPLPASLVARLVRARIAEVGKGR